jgi:hypothetical protein
MTSSQHTRIPGKTLAGGDVADLWQKMSVWICWNMVCRLAPLEAGGERGRNYLPAEEGRSVRRC